MTAVFERRYSEAYDTLYRDKDYASECDLIERILGDYAVPPVRNILDLGCGTGSHSLELARRGFQVVGVDSSDFMLKHARSKLAEAIGSVIFEEGDIRSFDLHREFDAAIMMFAVLSYQIENADLLSALRTAHRHMRPGAVLIFDFWYGPAVLSQGPSQRTKMVESGDERLLRVAAGKLDTGRGTCTVDYQLLRLRGDRLVSETHERHLMRYLFKPELELMLALSGFAPLRFGRFPEFDLDPDEGSWNVLGVARAAEAGISGDTFLGGVPVPFLNAKPGG